MEFNLPKIEKRILKFWKKKRIFQKSLEQRKQAKRFVFYEGPPTANAPPALHHIEARVFKDIIPRYKAMRGFYVLRKAGWDTHGLPVELQIEKKLGLKNKKEIEQYGIAKFNKKCEESVWEYKKEWEKLTERIGFWVDLKNPYITYENNYIESLWWILKEIWKKRLLYQDYKVVPHCFRCGTSLSSHEVALGYKKVKEKSAYLRFRIISDERRWKNTAILSWTTTPWTLPGNVALAINPKFDYLKIVDPVRKNYWLIVAKEALPRLKAQNILPQKAFKTSTMFKGKELLGLQYQPLFKVPQLVSENSYKVYPADFVEAREGTGVVHTAVMYGEEDYILGKRIGLPAFHTVTEEGRFIESLEEGLAGLPVKDSQTEKQIIASLKEKGFLFGEELYEHDYPFCWRCQTPLLYYAKASWFIGMTKVKEKLLANNQKINWFPSHLKNGRFGEWLREVKDWALSRERYWGTPLPIWRCEKCDSVKVVGSLKELENLSGKKPKNLHRPFIDEIVFKCEKCGGKMERVKEVIDCWFDSGAMPFAQWHYPFENKNMVDKKIQFPADYISEAIDQTRGWFYTLLAVSTILDCGPPYKNVISLGHVLDEKGEKMSKSKGNVVNPWEMIKKYGSDTLRWYFFTVNQPEDSKLFVEKDLENVVKRFFLILHNCLVFWETYREKSKTQISGRSNPKPKSKNPLDRWILSRLNNLIVSVTRALDEYSLVVAARLIENFVVNDFSQWYIRRSRRRLQKPESLKEKQEAEKTIVYVFTVLVKILAPFVPFLAEEIFQKISSSKNIFSVHLADWPMPEVRMISKSLEKDMAVVRQIVVEGLAQRAKAGIKVRQPLAKLKVKSEKLKVGEAELLSLIQEELNVKKVIFEKNLSVGAELDINITPELKEEGLVRDIIRSIQERRKKSGLKPQDEIMVFYQASSAVQKVFDKNKEMICREVIAQGLILRGEEDFVGEDEAAKKEDRFLLRIEKI